jgi:hypothetical protein
MLYTLVSGRFTQCACNNYLSVVLDRKRPCGELKVYPCARLHASTNVHNE